MNFPNTERALVEIIPVRAVTHLPKDYGNVVPMVWVTPIPHSGPTQPFLKQERYQLVAFDKGRTATKKLVDDLVSQLDGNYFQTSEGLIDKVEVVVTPTEEPLEDDALSSFSISVITHTRPSKGL